MRSMGLYINIGKSMNGPASIEIRWAYDPGAHGDLIELEPVARFSDFLALLIR